ncbi:hypothetical protein VTK26DRAFT_6475 [Humicola hyalothermophila]
MAAASSPSAPLIPLAQKARTIGHMNKDHRRDLRYIFLHYHDRSSPAAAAAAAAAASDSDPLMVDIDLDQVTVRFPDSAEKGKEEATYTIPFTPPLASWEERRARLVEMTRVAREALGVAGEDGNDGSGKGGNGGDEVMAAAAAVVMVDEYVPPRWPYDGTIFLAVLFYYLAWVLVRLGCCGCGSDGLVARAVEMARFPGGLDGFRWLVETIFVPVLGIHLTETWWLVRTRLSRFGVRTGSKVWWLWVGSVFIEGFMAFKRFDGLVERLRAEKKGR